MEEGDFNDNYGMEEDEEKDDSKLEVIMEENINSENNFSTNKKPIRDKNKSSSSSKIKSNHQSNYKQKDNEDNDENENNENNIINNLENNKFSNENDYVDKEEMNDKNNMIEKDINNIAKNKDNDSIDKIEIDRNNYIRMDINDDYSEKEENQDNYMINSENNNLEENNINNNNINDIKNNNNDNDDIQDKLNIIDKNMDKENDKNNLYNLNDENINEENKDFNNNDNGNNKESNENISNNRISNQENNNENEYYENNKFINDSHKKSEYNKEKNSQEKDKNSPIQVNNKNSNTLNDNNNVENNEKENCDDDNEIMELYSYEGNDINNNNNFNDNKNEEYFINKNIKEFQKKYNKNKNEGKKEKNNNLENEEEKNTKLYSNISNITYPKEKDISDEDNTNNKKRTYTIQTTTHKNNYSDIKNNYSDINNNINNNEEEISNENKNKLTLNKDEKNNNKTEIEKEKQVSCSKDAMRILQLLISQKQEKEEIEKKKYEDNKKFKRAQINKNIEDENNSDTNNINDNNNEIENNKNEEEIINNNESDNNSLENENYENIIKNKINHKYNTKNEKENDTNSISDNKIMNLGKIYIKNQKKMPYKRINVNKSVNHSKEKDAKIRKNISEKISPINKYKKLQISDNKNNYIFNTNPSSNNKYEKKNNRPFITPFNNNNIETGPKKPIRNKRIINNNNQGAHSTILNNKVYHSIDNSFEVSNIYKKRNIVKKDSTPSSELYQYKKPLNQRRNSYTKINSNQSNNYDINKVINNNKNMKLERYKTPLPNNYDKTFPVSNNNKYNNYFYNNINYNYKTTINKYLKTYKTTNNIKNKKNNFMNMNNNIDLSSDNIDNNQNNSNNNKSNVYLNYMHNKCNERLFYNKNNNYNSLDNYQYRQQQKPINRSLRYIHPYKKNIRKRLINDEKEYYDINNNDNEYDKNNNVDDNYYEYNNDYNNDYDNDNDNDYDNDYNYNEENYYNVNSINERTNSISINVEDLILLEEKLSDIIFILKTKKDVKKQCLDFWNYFYDSSFFNKIRKAFKSIKDIETTRICLNHELLSIMLCYEFSFDKNVLNKTYILLLEILELNHRNLMIICENILNKISLENKNNVWVLKLNRIVQNAKKEEEKYNQSSIYSEKINVNIDKIIKKIRNILFNYKTECSPLIMSLLKKITQKDYEEINDFFREYIMRNESVHNSNTISQFRRKPEFIPIQSPYIISQRKKPYTLVLGLDETLIYFRQISNNQGVLKLRPFLIEFLENVSQFYELILFTSKTEFYAEPIINAIEQKKKYFDFIFYKENCIIVGNDYIKDLSRIGRPLDSTIIIDSMPQYYRFQKENGINIKPFLAQNRRDRALYDLIPIMINIAEEELDVRDSLVRYREEIARKISPSIYNNYI